MSTQVNGEALQEYVSEVRINALLTYEWFVTKVHRKI